jgi:hypothetical protein
MRSEIETALLLACLPFFSAFILHRFLMKRASPKNRPIKFSIWGSSIATVWVLSALMPELVTIPRAFQDYGFSRVLESIFTVIIFYVLSVAALGGLGFLAGAILDRFKAPTPESEGE